MRTFLFGLLAVLLCAAPLRADYTTANITSIDSDDDGRLHVVVVFTGNAGEKSQPFNYFLDGGTSDIDAAFRARAVADVNRLNGLKSLKGKLSVGPVDLTPVTLKPVTLTPCQTFMGDYFRLQRIQQAVDLGVIAADDKDVAALKSQVQGEYAASCLANF